MTWSKIKPRIQQLPYLRENYKKSQNIIIFKKNMEMSLQHQNSQLISNQDKYEKDSPINTNTKHNYSSEIKPRKSPGREIIVGMLERIVDLERRVEQLQRLSLLPMRKKKKIRRKAKQIHRDYMCSYITCQKVYGSKTSLKNHMKLKHGYRMRRYIIQSKQNCSE